MGISPQATAQEIKRAYQLKAQLFHPDKGGHPDDFNLIRSAYEILKHIDRRAAYDATGDDLYADEGEIIKKAQGELSGLFSTVVDHMDPMNDLTDLIKTILIKNIQSIEEDQKKHKQSIKKMEKINKRIKKKSQDQFNMFKEVLVNKIKVSRMNIITLENNLRMTKRMLEFLDDYEYDTSLEVNDYIHQQLKYDIKLLTEQLNY